MSQLDASGSLRRALYVATLRRDAAKRRLRRWKRHLAKWSQQATFPGSRYADLLEEGRARPYQLGDLRHELLRVMSREAVDAIEHVLAVERGFGRHQGGMRASYTTWARILKVSPKTAQRVLHELVELDLIDQRHWFRRRTSEERQPRSREDVLNGAPKHFEVPPRYVSTVRLRTLADASRQARSGAPVDKSAGLPPKNGSYVVGHDDQPGRIQRPLRGHLVGRTGPRRPVRQFAEEVLTRRAAAERELLRLEAVARIKHAAVRVVRQDGHRVWLSDGRVMHVPTVSAAVLAERLRKARARGEVVDEVQQAIADAWAAFERRPGSGVGA